MVEWSRVFYTDPATTGLNAVIRGSAPEEQLANEELGAGPPGRSASVSLRVPESIGKPSPPSHHHHPHTITILTHANPMILPLI